MENDTDEFTDSFDQQSFDDPSEAPAKASVKSGLKQAWNTKPVFKLLVIMGVVIVALTVVLSMTSSKKEAPVSKLAKAPDMREVPGGVASPFFIEQNEQANEARARAAMLQGGSAMPTPVGSMAENGREGPKDPLVEFKAETERLRNQMEVERTQNAQKVQTLERQLAARPQQAPVQQQQQPQQQDDALAQAMQKQMQALMKSWEPQKASFVKGREDDLMKEAKAAAMQPVAPPSVQVGSSLNNHGGAKVIVPAGTVNYMQLLTEANSDVPGPILAQILSGPLAGGRAIGSFQVMNDLLVMQFNHVSWKGRDYSINALALDPDTTLGGMATEVNNRYFLRVVLPAAAAFVSEFGSAMGNTGTRVTSKDGVIFSEQARQGYKDALYSSLGSAGQSVAQFLQQQASQTKKMVRVAVGTPMGLFFTNSVTDGQLFDDTQPPPAIGQPAAESEPAAPLYQQTGNSRNQRDADGLTQDQRAALERMMANTPTATPVNATPIQMR